jgi:hypothetical protein
MLVRYLRATQGKGLHVPKTGYTDFMTITIEIPDELVPHLVCWGQEPARAVVEPSRSMHTGMTG